MTTKTESKFSNILWKSQLDALARMHNGCILAGGVGSGKSRTAIAYWLEKAYTPEVYVITTAMKRDSMEWAKDFAALSKWTEEDKKHIHIDSWNRIKEYANVTDAFFIFDEQKVVGRGIWAKSFLKIVQHNKWILLSGTPGDVWMDYVPVFIANGYFRNRSEFERNHVVFSRFTKYPKVERYVGTAKLERLRRDILVEMPTKRHTKRIIEDIICDYDRDMYEKGTKTRFDIFKNEPMKDAGGLCLFQRRVVNSARSRYMSILEIAQSHPKLIIFYSFDYELEILRGLQFDLFRAVYERNGHKHDILDESLPAWVYLVQYSSGSEAWNCTTTDAIVFYSQTYSWKVREQAMGRIDRANTPFTNLYYYTLKSDSTIDRAIAKAIEKKRIFNEKAYSSHVRALEIESERFDERILNHERKLA